MQSIKKIQNRLHRLKTEIMEIEESIKIAERVKKPHFANRLRLMIQKKLEKGKKKLLKLKELQALEKKLELLNKEEEDSSSLSNEEMVILNQLGLLSLKPKIIVCNVDEESLVKGNKYTETVKNKFLNEKVVIICADIEDQIMGLDNEERETFMKEIGLGKTGLIKLIREGYDLLNLDTYFTSGPEESRAWTIKKKYFGPPSCGYNSHRF